MTDMSPRKIKMLFDWVATSTYLASMSDEMINARIVQGVTQPDFVRVGFNRQHCNQSSDSSIESSYRKCKDRCQELWLTANKQEEDHTKGFSRKGPVHLLKLICNLKIVRLIFNPLAGKPFGDIRCDQGDRVHKSQKILQSFFDNVVAEVRAYVESHCQTRQPTSSENPKMFRVITIDANDVDAAFHLLTYQMETSSILFSVEHLKEVVGRRTGRPYRPTASNESALQKFVNITIVHWFPLPFDQ